MRRDTQDRRGPRPHNEKQVDTVVSGSRTEKPKVEEEGYTVVSGEWALGLLGRYRDDGEVTTVGTLYGSRTWT